MPYYPPPSGGSSNSAGLATNAATYILSSLNANLANAFIIQPGSSVTTHITGSNLYINATTSASAGGAASPVVPGYQPLANVLYINLQSGNLGSGFTDLYTVPVGKRAYWMSEQLWNNGSGTINAYLALKSNSIYYRILDNQSVSTLAAAINNTVTMGFNAGEIMAINTDSFGLNVFCKVIEFSTSSNFKTVRLLTFTSGFNTVYTVPVNSSAMLITRDASVNGVNLGVNYVNNSSDTRTIRWYAVRAGSSATPNYRVSLDINVSTLVRSYTNYVSTLSSGDAVVIATDSASSNQMAWVDVMEV